MALNNQIISSVAANLEANAAGGITGANFANVTSNLQTFISNNGTAVKSVSIQSSTDASFTANYILTLPVNDGSSGQVLATDGSGVLSWANVSTSNIVNGNSNVNVEANANVTISSAGNANIVVVTGTGANVTGTLNVSANANTGNLGTAALIATGNVAFTSSPNVVLGAVGNVHITGGSANQYLQTDGTGNLSFQTLSTSSISNGNSNVDIPSANGNVNISAVGNANVLVVTGTGANVTGTANVTGNIIGGNIVTTGQITSTQAGNLSNGAGQLFLNGAGNNRIDFNQNGLNPPSFTTRSAGTKIVLYPQVNASNVDYAIGVNGSTLWTSLPQSNTNASFKWYGGTTEVANLSGTGDFIAANITAGNIITTANGGIIAVSNNGTSTQQVVIKASTAAGFNANYTLTLPINDGAANQYLQTDGSGVLAWATIASVPSLINGNSNVVVNANANVTISSNGVANVVVVTSTGANVTGNFNASGDIVGARFGTTGTANVGTLNATGNVNSQGQITSTRAGNASTGAGQLYLNGSGNNRIDFNTNGVNPPTFSTRSDGTKIVLYPSLGGGSVDYGIGIEGQTVWTSVPESNATSFFKWYAGTTEVANLSGLGDFIGRNFKTTPNGGIITVANNGSSNRQVIIQASTNASFTGNYTLTLPINDGDSGQALVTDGSGILSWQTVSTSSLANGNSNIAVLSNTAITMSSNGIANAVTVNSNSSTTLLTVGIETGGGTSITDNSVNAVTIDFGGAAGDVSANVDYPSGGSGYSARYSASQPSAPGALTTVGAYNMGTGDWTLEGWYYLYSGAVNAGNAKPWSTTGNLSNVSSSVTSLRLWDSTGFRANQPGFVVGSEVYSCFTSNTVTRTTWFHAAWVKNGTSFAMYLNGNVVTVANTTGGDSRTSVTLAGTEVFDFGSASAPSIPLPGYSSQTYKVRLSNTALYTANFTPSAAYGNTANTVFLLNAESIALSQAGNILAGNITLTNIANFAGNVIMSGANVSLGAVGNLHITGGSSGEILTTDGAGNLSWSALSAGSTISNGNSNVNIPSANGNVNISAVGNANIVVVTGTGANITGTLNVSANANVGNLGTTTAIITTGNITTVNTGLVQNGNSNVAITANANVTITANSNSTMTITDTGANITGTLNVTANANVGNLGTNIANITTANVTTAIIGTGNITTVNTGLVQNGNSNIAITANANITLTAKSNATMVISDTGANITGTANITGNLATGGNLTVSGTGVTSIAGNIDMNGKWVGNIGYAVANTDAASKLYVDTLVSTGISYHSPVNAATTTTLAVATGGTVAYNEPGGAGNGIGAFISTTGTFTTIDGVTINSSTSIRILVKDEANGAFNGVYTYTNATAITRSTDADQAGVGSTERLGINDYFFTQAGTVNLGTAFIVSAPAGTITFGTSNIQFSIFSSSQVYTGGTGITVSGTVISANANQSQVTTVGTLGNLDVSGNTTSGNFIGIFANGNSNVSIPAANGNVNISAVGNANVVTVTGSNVVLGNAVGLTFVSNNGTALRQINIKSSTDAGFSANYALTLPTTDGDSGQVLATDGSGVLSWTSVGVSGLSNGTSNIAIALNSNISMGVGGSANILNLGSANSRFLGDVYFANSIYVNAAGGGGIVGNITNGTDSNIAIAPAGNGQMTFVASGNTMMTITGTAVSINGTGNINGGNIISSVRMIATGTGQTGNGGGQLYLNGATLNRIDYNTAGGAAPSNTTRSAGTKITFYPAVDSTNVDYAVGIAAGALWHSVPGSGEIFKWYGGITEVANLTGDGTFTATILRTAVDGSLVAVANNGSANRQVTIKASTDAGFTGNYTLTLPINDGDSGQVLQTNGSGVLSWVAPGGSSASISNGTSNVNIPSSDGNVNISSAGSANILVVTGTSVNISGQITSNKAGNASTGGGQLYLNGSGNNRIDFGTAGQGAPTVTTRSQGTKITIYPELSSTAVDYAIGHAAGVLWQSVPGSAESFKWYANTTEITSLDGGGTFTTDVYKTAVNGGFVAVGNNGSSNRQVRIQASNNASFTGNYTLILPVNDGDNGQVLTTDGSGVLSWGAAGGIVSSISNGNSNVDIASANGNVTISAVGNANVLVVTGTSVVTTGQIISTRAGNLSDGGGQLYLNGSGNNRIDFNTNGTGAPTFTTRSAGTKIALYPSLSGSAGDYALGVDAGTLWNSLPAADAGQFFKWYGGTTEVANLSGTGVFQVVGNANVGNLGTATAIITTGNITTVNTGLVQNGNSNIAITSNANITLTAKSNATMVISDTGANITGTANISGNANVGNLGTAGLVATGDVNFTTSPNVSLGAVGNVKITGGTADYVLQTDGTGNLSWVAQSGGGGGGASIANGNSNVNIATANGNVTVSAVGNANILVVTGTGANVTGTANVTGNVIGGNIVTTGQITSTQAGNASTGGGQLYLNGSGNVRIDFSASGLNPPAFTTRSSGQKITLYPALTGSEVDYAIGVASGAFWSSIDQASSSFDWFAGTTEIANLTGTGAFQTAGNITAPNFLGNLVGAFANGNSNISINANGNINMSIGGNVNKFVIDSSGNLYVSQYITGSGGIVLNSGNTNIRWNVNNQINFQAIGTNVMILTNTSIAPNANVIPASSNNFTLGNSSNYFANAYIDDLTSSFLDSENPIGFRNVPIVSVAANVANTVASDAGKAFFHASGAAVNTVNIAANANVSYINGTVLTFINLSANALTISCGDTMTFIANGATGTRTLANNGMATAIKVANTAWVITGSNIT
jgi:hypothetical protein